MLRCSCVVTQLKFQNLQADRYNLYNLTKHMDNALHQDTPISTDLAY